MKVVIRVIVRDVRHVHVFTSRVPTTVRAASIVIRIRRKAASVPRALVPVCRAAALPSVAAMQRHTSIRGRRIIIMRGAIVLVRSTASSRAAIVLVRSTVSSRVVIVPVRSMVSRAAIVPATTSRQKERRVVTSLVSSMVSPVRAAISSVVVMASLVRVVTASSAKAAISSVAVTVSLVRAATVSSVAAIVSARRAMIPMPSTA